MSSQLKIDLLFKKYSEYFAYKQTISVTDHSEDRPFLKDKTRTFEKQKDSLKPEGAKLKASKLVKQKTSQVKHVGKDSATQTKKSKNNNSVKVTPREGLRPKQTQKQPKKVSNSVTPDKSARKSVRKTQGTDLFGKTDQRPKKKPEQKPSLTTRREKERWQQSLTDRTFKPTTGKSRSKSKQNANMARLLSKQNTTLNQQKQSTRLNFKRKHVIRIKTEYSHQKQQRISHEDSLHLSSKQMTLSWLNPHDRDKLLIDEIYSKEESYRSPVIPDEPEGPDESEELPRSEKLEVLEVGLKTPKSFRLLQSQQTQNVVTSSRQQYYIQQLARVKHEEEVRWQRTIQVLKELKESGNKEILDRLIGESQENRQRLRTKQSIDRYKCIYDEDVIKEKYKSKEVIESIKSREASSKKLLEDLQQASYNQIQLEHHFDNLKEDSMNSSLKNINIGQYLNEVRKHQETSKQPDFDQIQVEQAGEDKSQVNSLIQLIRHDLEDHKKSQYNSIVQDIVESVILQFGGEIIGSKDILHAFLSHTNYSTNQLELKVELAQPVQDSIKSSNSFVLQVTRGFLNNILERGLQDFKKAICIPFGEKPHRMLRYLREVGDQDKEDNQGRYQSIIPVNSFIQFEPLLKQRVKMSSTISQYFFNHCIFDCINQNLDRLRPFGLKGLPPLCFKENFQPPKFSEAQRYINKNMENIVSFGIGREIDDYEEEDAFKIIDDTFRRLDKLTLLQTDVEWSDNNDLEFELVFDLSNSIVDWLFKDEVRKLYSLIL